MSGRPTPGVARLSTGVSLPYLERGDRSGLPLLLIHAWGESLGSFSRLAPLLPNTVRAIAMDQRGHGHADKPADGYAMADYVADLVAFLCGPSSASVTGASFAMDGGWTAH